MSMDPNQGQPDSGQGPYSEQGTPSNPYSAPQPSYSPPENPYDAPPNPYATPPPMGDPGQGYGYAYAVPPATPLPLGEAIQQLPNQYVKVLTKPSAMTFAEEMGKADWGIVWIQLIGYAIIAAVLGYLRSLAFPLTPVTTTSSSSINPATLQAFALGGSLASILIIPIVFFIWTGILYGLAKAFGGQGTFVAQGYTYLLFQVPLGIISAVLNFIPIAGSLVALALAIYAIVLNIFSIMAVHRLSGGKASAVVLIPYGVLLLLACALVVVFIFIIAAAVRSTSP